MCGNKSIITFGLKLTTNWSKVKRTGGKDPGLWGRYENIFSSNGERKLQFLKLYILMKERFSIFFPKSKEHYRHK